MQKFLKTGNARLYILLGSMFVVGSAWRAGDAINQRLLQLPVTAAPRVDRNSVSIAKNSFYPVWVKQAVATPPAPNESEGESVDALFMAKQEPKIEPPRIEAPPEPDYVQMFKQAARIDGVSDDGIFVGGRFYKVGQKMEEFQFSGPSGTPIIPSVESIRAGKITFAIGKDKLVFQTGGVR